MCTRAEIEWEKLTILMIHGSWFINNSQLEGKKQAVQAVRLKYSTYLSIDKLRKCIFSPSSSLSLTVSFFGKPEYAIVVI